MGAKRNFSKKQRLTLLLLSGGRCGLCGDEINEYNFHADHIIPYSLGGKTVVRNGQALCITCNLKKGNKSMGKSLDTIEYREWQREGYKKVFGVWAPSDTPLCVVKPNVLVAVSTGAGKTIFAVVCYHGLCSEHNVNLMLVVVPNKAIKYNWIKSMNELGIPTHGDVTNETLRYRIRNDSTKKQFLDGKQLVITNQQLASDPELFADIVRNHKTFLVSDEIHHSDDAREFGESLMAIAPLAAFKLALSATPFNSSGGVLAMCDFEDGIDKHGDKCRTAITTYEYNYGEAVRDKVCRRVEFITITGKVEDTLIDLVTGKTYVAAIDLERENSSESFKSLLRADGVFFKEMAINSLIAFTNSKRVDPRAGLLVLAMNIDHAREIMVSMKELCKENPEWSAYKFKDIYHDSIDACRQIEELNHDDTDIIITVRMVSEGVDVQRLKVLLYATDYKTPLFFNQSTGRVVRFEAHLPDSQFGVVVIPAHRLLMEFAQEIEDLCREICVRDKPKKPKGPGTPRNETELLNSVMTVGRATLICQGQVEFERHYADSFFKSHVHCKGKITEYDAAQSERIIEARIMEELRRRGSSGEWSSEKDDDMPTLKKTCNYATELKEREQVSDDNDTEVAIIVKYLIERNGEGTNYYQRINGEANRFVGIKNKDEMTSIETLKKRLMYLRELKCKLQAGLINAFRYKSKYKPKYNHGMV